MGGCVGAFRGLVIISCRSEKEISIENLEGWVFCTCRIDMLSRSRKGVVGALTI